MNSKNIQILTIIFLSILILSLGFFSSYNNYIDSVKNQHVRLVEKINSIKSVINYNEILSLKGDSTDVTNVDYISLKQKLTALNNSTPNIRYTYLLGMRDSSLFFYIDSEPDNRNYTNKTDLAEPGEKYQDAPKEFYDAYFNKKEIICKPYTDKWGNFISVVSPILSQNNEMIALIGVDVLNEDFISFLQPKVVSPILLSVVLVLVFFIIYFVIGQKYIDERSLYSNITKIRSALNSYTESLIIVNKDYSIEFINYTAKIFAANVLNINIEEKYDFNHFINAMQNKELKDRIKYLFDNCTVAENKYVLANSINDKIVIVGVSPVYKQQGVVNQLIIDIKAGGNKFKKPASVDYFDEEKLILEHINEVVWQVNFEGIIISVTSSVNQLLGYNKEDLIFKNIESFISPTSKIKLNNALDSLNKAAENISKVNETLLVLEINSKLGGFIDVENRIIIKNNSIGEPVGAVMVMRKVNENIDAIIELYETKKTIQTYFNHIPGVIYRCSIDKNWTMKFMSNGCFDLTGYHVEDFIDNNKLSFSEIILPEFQELLWSKWQKVIENAGLFEGQYKIKTANNENKWVLEKGRCVYDDNGNPVALEGFIIDVSDKVRSEDLIRFNEQRFRDYLESTTLCSLVTDKNGNIKDFSTSFSVFLGVEKISLYNKLLFEFIDETNLDEFIHFFENLKTQPNIDIIVKMKSRDLGLFVSIYASKVYENEFIFYIVNNNEIITKNINFKNELSTLSLVVSNLPIPVFIVDIKSRKVINKSNCTSQIGNLVNCPCELIQKNPNIICSISNSECLINQMISRSEIIHSNFNLFLGEEEKYFDVWISPVIDEDEKGVISHAIVTFIENTEFYQTKNKLSEASSSLENIFYYHFQNLSFRMQRIYKIMHADNENNDSKLISYLQSEYNNLTFLHNILSNKDEFSVKEVCIETLFAQLFYNINSREVLYKGKNIFYINELSSEMEVELNEKSFIFIVDYAVNYSVLHSSFPNIKIVQFINSDNKLEINIKFFIDDLIDNQINTIKSSSFFNMFTNYETTPQIIIDFAFLRKICLLLNVDMDFIKNKSNEVTCKLIFEPIVQMPINKVTSEKHVKKAAVICSDKEVLNYVCSTLEEKCEEVISFIDYIDAIKVLSNYSERYPDIIFVDELVNNIKAIDIINKISTRFTSETLVVISCSQFKKFERSEYTLIFSNVRFIEYPYTKSELIDLVLAKH